MHGKKAVNMVAGIGEAANNRLVEVDARGHGCAGSGEMYGNGFQHKFVTVGFLVEGNERAVNTGSSAENVVTRIDGHNVGVQAVDPGEDVNIRAGFLKSVIEILAEKSSGDEAIV